MFDENGELLQPKFDDPVIAEAVMRIYSIGKAISEYWENELKNLFPVDKNEKR